MSGPPPSASALLLKRIVDLVLLALLAAPSLILVSCCALLTRLLTGGPALYYQTRVGFGGRHISVWKLRTMVLDAESVLERHLAENPDARLEWESFYKLQSDPRIIPYIGQFLRRSSLDELPQLYNVLVGEMSLVGPRPLPLYHLQAYDQEFRMARQSVPPGVTGLWQISERSDGDLNSHRKWDHQYLANFSLLLDLQILARTPLVVLRCRAAR
jgi:lipopolysaccharide/colanic/teichoic acid biosynthesis glycosyltransferase